jgi:hypothetical protein
VDRLDCQAWVGGIGNVVDACKQKLVSRDRVLERSGGFFVRSSNFFFTGRGDAFNGYFEEVLHLGYAPVLAFLDTVGVEGRWCVVGSPRTGTPRLDFRAGNGKDALVLGISRQ